MAMQENNVSVLLVKCQ